MKTLNLLLISFILFPAVCFSAQDVTVLSLDDSIANTMCNVTTAATPLPTTALKGRKVVTIENIGNVTLYIGGSTVTANEAMTGGLQLKNDGDTFTVDATDDIIIYGIIASGTEPCAVLEVR